MSVVRELDRDLDRALWADALRDSATPASTEAHLHVKDPAALARPGSEPSKETR